MYSKLISKFTISDEVLEVNGLKLCGKSVHDICSTLCQMSGTLTFVIIPAQPSNQRDETAQPVVRYHQCERCKYDCSYHSSITSEPTSPTLLTMISIFRVTSLASPSRGGISSMLSARMTPTGGRLIVMVSGPRPWQVSSLAWPYSSTG